MAKAKRDIPVCYKLVAEHSIPAQLTVADIEIDRTTGIVHIVSDDKMVVLKRDQIGTCGTADELERAKKQVEEGKVVLPKPETLIGGGGKPAPNPTPPSSNPGGNPGDDDGYGDDPTMGDITICPCDVAIDP
jgi:hypothetical protein